MKSQFSLFILMIAAVSLFVSCQGDKDKSVRDAARQSLPKTVTTPPPPPPPTANPNVPSPTATAGGVMHYICPNNCESSGGPGAGTCPVCGTAYTHNQAWHGQNDAASTITNTIDPTNTTVPTQITPPAAEPPQNANGVWHYICPSGCTGGGGGATPCATCGTTLAHNTAYHN